MLIAVATLQLRFRTTHTDHAKFAIVLVYVVVCGQLTE